VSLFGINQSRIEQQEPSREDQGFIFYERGRFMTMEACGLPTTGDPIWCEEITTVQLAVPLSSRHHIQEVGDVIPFLHGSIGQEVSNHQDPCPPKPAIITS